jgi:hypothetical protein
VAHRAISLLSLRVVWSLTGNPPAITFASGTAASTATRPNVR